MSHRTKVRAFILASICVCIAFNAMAVRRCPEKTTTRAVYVEFKGCSSAQPGLKFDVLINGEIITVSKKSESDQYWSGQTSKLFVITDPRMTILANAMPTARATCGTNATALKDGQCIALFSVQCEPLWLLKVEHDKKKKATIKSRLDKGSSKAIQTCSTDARPEEIEGPVEVELALSEKLLVTIGAPGSSRKPPSSLVVASLTYGSFGSRTELTLNDPAVSLKGLPPQGQPPTQASEETMKAEARATFPGIKFTRNCLTHPCGK